VKTIEFFRFDSSISDLDRTVIRPFQFCRPGRSLRGRRSVRPWKIRSGNVPHEPSTVISGFSMRALSASQTSATLWGGMLVAIPTAIPVEPLQIRWESAR
jgi:hypothetical protein